MANTKKRWTADEIEILRKYYPAEGDQVCERLSGRTAKSCRIQAVSYTHLDVYKRQV